MAVETRVVLDAWNAEIDGDLCPRPHPSVGSILVDDVAILTHDRADAAVALDPFSTVLWQSFDGETSLAALALDVEDALGVGLDEANRQVLALAHHLAWHGFLERPHLEGSLRAQHFPELRPQDCPSQKMNLPDATLVDLELPDARIRVGSTDREVVEWIESVFASLVIAADPTEEREVVCANIGEAENGRRPRHRVYDHWGNQLFSSQDRTLAATALARTVHDRIAMAEGGVWFRVATLLDGEGATRATLVHRGLDGAHEQARPILDRRGVRAHHSPYARVDPATLEVVLASGSPTFPGSEIDAHGQRDDRVPLASVLLPTLEIPTHERVRAFSQNAATWDQVHLEAAATFVQRLPNKALIPSTSPSALADGFLAAVRDVG